jgi:hypothetical protein
MKNSVIFGYKNTSIDNEDLALTPYFFLVKSKIEKSKIIGIGFCWIEYSFYVAIGINLPKNYPNFFNHKK